MKAVEGWRSGRLGEICSIEIGGTPARSNPDYWDVSKETANLWVAIRDLSKPVITDTAEYLSDSGIKHSNAKLQKQGTVLLSFKLSIGRVAFAGVPLYTNEAIAGLNSSKIDLCYLYHGLHQWDLLQDVDQAIKGATLNKAKLKKITFEYPESSTEQTKIAEILSTVDRAIEQTEALIAKQQRIKTGLMQDLLTRGIDEHGNLRSEQTHQFKDSSLGRIPVEWEVKMLRDLVDEDITYGIVQAGPHIENGVPYIRTGDMANDVIDVKTLLRTSIQIAESYKRSTVRCRDIVFALRATVGKVLPVTKELDGANLTQGTAKISPKESIDSNFFLWVMRSSKVQDEIRIDLKGTTFMEITLGNLRKITLALPKKKPEQTVIGEKLEKLDCLRRSYERHLDKLHSLKTALMQDLLTGKVRVTPLLTKSQEAGA